jgi:hypothetical protein
LLKVIGRLEGECGAKKCVHMYVYAKMIPVETILGIGEEDKGEW